MGYSVGGRCFRLGEGGSSVLKCAGLAESVIMMGVSRFKKSRVC